MAEKVEYVNIIQIEQLPELFDRNPDFFIPVRDGSNKINYKLKVGALISSESVQASWDAEFNYNEGQIINQTGAWWQSKVTDGVSENIGNFPTEGDFWTKLSSSAANGAVAYWAAGVFSTAPQICVVKANGGTVLIDAAYILKSSVTLPFNSTVSPENDATNWQSLGSSDIDEDTLSLNNTYPTLGVNDTNSQADLNNEVEKYIAGLDGGGFCHWNDPNVAKWSITGTAPTATFNLLVGGEGRILGKRVEFAAQSIANLPSTYSLYFVACNASGVISLQTTIDWNNYFPLFHLFVGVSGAYYVGRENHPFAFTRAISSYLHNTLGTLIYGAGGNVAIGSTTTQVAIQGAATFSDHGLESPIPDSAGTGVTWLQDFKNTLGQWALYSLSANIAPYYNLNGVATALTSGRFGVYRLYAAKDDGNLNSNARYVACMHTSEFNTSSAALTAINAGQIIEADGLLTSVEIAQLGYCIVSSAGVVVQTVIQKKTAVTGTSGGTTGLSAVAYDGLHSSTTGRNDLNQHQAIAINPNGSANKLAKSNATGDQLDFTSYNYDQVVQTGAIDYSQSSWLVGESRLLLTTKQSSSAGTFDGAAELMDLILPPGVLATLEASDANWVNETKTVTGDNTAYALGRTGQFGWLSDRTFVQCTSATYAVSGSATFNRNRAVDALVLSDTQDFEVIKLLEPSRTGGTDDDGWNLTTNTKIISTVPCKVSTYWIGGTNGEGYYFSCFAVSGSNYYWKRIGQGATVQRPITTASHPLTTAALQAYDWSLGKYTQTSNPISTDPYTYQDQTFIDDSNGYYYIKTDPTKWTRFEANKSPRKVTLTNAQIKALATTPVTLLAAPASGYVYAVDTVLLELNAGTEALTVSEDSDLSVRYNGSTINIFDNIETTGLLDQTTNQISISQAKNAINGATTSMAAKAVEIVNLGTQIAGNASNNATLDVVVFYSLIKL